ncbi:hypothetical protein V1506DRAFT_555654 [Lipomyces tetrasporus]
MTAARILAQITQEKANQIITSRHIRTTDLGCWEANGKPDDKGYGHVTLMHQIALIAYNRLDELKVTLGRSNYDISHLCHNGNVNNQRRKICNGQKILVHDGFSYHPCPHARVEKLRKCILPVHHLEDNTPNCGGQTSAPASTYQLGCWHQRGYYCLSRFDVSHLCHNGKCFNPEHIIVESTTNNLRRRSCNGHKVITYGHFTYHPCPHGGVEKMRKCILPTLRLEAGHHENKPPVGDLGTKEHRQLHGNGVTHEVRATSADICHDSR